MQPVMQERVESGVFKPYIQHKPIERYIINTHAFHNAHLLRKMLTRSLFAPIPLFPVETRKAKHIEIANNLRVTQKTKLEARAAHKRTETTMATKDSTIPRKRTRMEVKDGDTQMETQLQ